MKIVTISMVPKIVIKPNYDLMDFSVFNTGTYWCFHVYSMKISTRTCRKWSKFWEETGNLLINKILRYWRIILNEITLRNLSVFCGQGCVPNSVSSSVLYTPWLIIEIRVIKRELFTCCLTRAPNSHKIRSKYKKWIWSLLF